MIRKIFYFLIALAVALLLFLMASANVLRGTEAQEPTGYRQITPQEAKALMDSNTGWILLDVRTQEEYDSGHIPGATLLPNETIGTAEIPSLPSKSQMILIYCRSGNRSKQAAMKLENLGYTNLYEFGGIITWPYEIEGGT